MTLRQDSMSTRMAQITQQVAVCGGQVTEDRLDEIMREFGITRQNRDYKKRMVEYSYLQYDRTIGRYCLTDESSRGAAITVTVKPSLYTEEVRRHLVEMLAGYGGLIEIGEVEL